MNNKRINVHYINAELNTIWDKTKEKDFPPMNRHMAYGILVDKLLAELKRCYKELDELPTRQELMDIFDYQKWLEYVESCFLADGSFNQDADFVRMCAVNERYGYRIEVIDGVETVVHESEY